MTGLAPLENEFEAEAAMRLETAAAERIVSAYPFELITGPGACPGFVRRHDPEDRYRDEPRRRAVRDLGQIPQTLAKGYSRSRPDGPGKIRGSKTVVLCGGVFLNKKLLHRAAADLVEKRIPGPQARPLFAE